MTVENAYLQGVLDAIVLIEKGVSQGLSFEDSLECLKSSVKKNLAEQLAKL